jgi:uncharacterized tellurite resistance protein B-like protein
MVTRDPSQLLETAVLRVMAVMMLIDHEVEEHEVTALRDTAKRLLGYVPELGAIEDAVRNASVQETEAFLRENFRAAPREQREAIVGASLAIAGADGELRDVEHEFVTILAGAMLLDDNDVRKVWARQAG